MFSSACFFVHSCFASRMHCIWHTSNWTGGKFCILCTMYLHGDYFCSLFCTLVSTLHTCVYLKAVLSDSVYLCTAYFSKEAQVHWYYQPHSQALATFFLQHCKQDREWQWVYKHYVYLWTTDPGPKCVVLQLSALITQYALNNEGKDWPHPKNPEL